MTLRELGLRAAPLYEPICPRASEYRALIFGRAAHATAPKDTPQVAHFTVSVFVNETFI